MDNDIKRLFKKFKDKYHRAVIKDEALGYDESGSYVKEKKARDAWGEAKEAEQEFLEALDQLTAIGRVTKGPLRIDVSRLTLEENEQLMTLLTPGKE